MAKQKLQLQHLPKYNLRLQPDMKANLERLAKAASRSLNAEITERLEKSLELKQALKDYTDGELIDELMRRLGKDNVVVSIRIAKDESP